MYTSNIVQWISFIQAIIIIAIFSPSRHLSSAFSALLCAVFTTVLFRPEWTPFFDLPLGAEDKQLEFSFSPSQRVFLGLFVFKFLKHIIHTISYLAYKPTPQSANPRCKSSDCTIVIPTVGDFGHDFLITIKTVLANNPAQIIISTVGNEKLEKATRICYGIDPSIKVIAVSSPNKRKQAVAGWAFAKTSIIVTCDDHIDLPPTFLVSALAPFEDPKVGVVGTVKRVNRERKALFSSADILNYLAVNYLERHNFECTASSNIDGGAFVISGRTALYQAHILQSPEFQKGFLNETWFFGRVGPMNVDDDNFITRFMLQKGYKTVFHNSPDALMRTPLGVEGWVKFSAQLDRWVRTTWRSNSTLLFSERTPWLTQPWSVYGVYLSLFVNLNLFYDSALFVTLASSSWGTTTKLFLLGLAILLSKLIKPLPHLLREPRDWPYFLINILFGWVHSLIKLKALFTVFNIAWGSRPGIDGVVSLDAAGTLGVLCGSVKSREHEISVVRPEENTWIKGLPSSQSGDVLEPKVATELVVLKIG
jgi:cellulose synthase/poly-beta-1,6-N-acetylglucosamine synthase-like glycosyltransferase